VTRELEVVVAWPGWSPLERQLANQLLRETGQQAVALWLSVALLTRASREGDVCIDLERAAGRRFSEVLAQTSRDAEVGFSLDLMLPKLPDWVALLTSSGFVGDDSLECPLTLKRHRLYLTRYRQHEAVLAARIVERLVVVQRPFQRELVQPLLEHWFEGAGSEAKDAAAIAANRRFCLITGGPGTGKTSAVVRMLGLLSDLSATTGGKPARVLLLAPTGKAAARLSESIVQAKQRLHQLSTRIGELATKASTVHAVVAGCRRLADGSQIPLSADIIILDEASMVDLALMRRLLDVAVNVERLVVLGDPYQLASVEAGAVLGELCARSASGESPLVSSVNATSMAAHVPHRIDVAEHYVEFTVSHRFRHDGGIGLLAQSIKRGDVSAALNVLSTGDAQVRFIEVSEQSLNRVEEHIVRANATLLASTSPTEALAQLGRFRVLCAHRKGRFGVETWNERLRRRVAQASGRGWPRTEVEPILITENAPDVTLHNGDLGIVWREPSRTRAWFVLPDGRATELGLSRLPRHEPAFAMSVHKSQGSEVDEVLVLLPEAGSALLTRELLYTAVTRARRHCTLVGTRAAIEQAILRKVERRSGLGDAINELVDRRAGQGS